MFYLSGQIGIDPQTGQLVSNDTTNQTKQILKNLEALLGAADSSVQQIAHCLISLTNIGRDYSIVNDIYSKWFSSFDYVKLIQNERFSSFYISSIILFDFCPLIM